MTPVNPGETCFKTFLGNLAAAPDLFRNHYNGCRVAKLSRLNNHMTVLQSSSELNPQFCLFEAFRGCVHEHEWIVWPACDTARSTFIKLPEGQNATRNIHAKLFAQRSADGSGTAANFNGPWESICSPINCQVSAASLEPLWPSNLCMSPAKHWWFCHHTTVSWEVSLLYGVSVWQKIRRMQFLPELFLDLLYIFICTYHLETTFFQ